MNSKAKMKKNLTRLVCLVLAAIMLIGCFAYFTMEEVETHDYSAGLTEEGFFEGITALDNVVLPDYHAYTIPEDATIATEDEINSKIHTEILSAYATQEKDTDADRVVADGDSIHFFKKHSDTAENLGFDMQRIDMGIAMAHFDLAMQEQGTEGCFEKIPVSIDVPQGLKYIISWKKS